MKAILLYRIVHNFAAFHHSNSPELLQMNSSKSDNFQCMACQPPSTLESLKEVQSHFRTKHSVSKLLTSRATKVVALPSSLSCHNLPSPLPHVCLLCEHKDGKCLSDGKLREHMAEMHGKFFSNEWEQFSTFHCRWVHCVRHLWAEFMISTRTYSSWPHASPRHNRHNI